MWSQYSRREPSGKLRNFSQEHSRRCWETAGWEIRNSRWMTSGQGAGRVLPPGEEFEDAPSYGIAEHVEGVHHPEFVYASMVRRAAASATSSVVPATMSATPHSSPLRPMKALPSSLAKPPSAPIATLSTSAPVATWSPRPIDREVPPDADRAGPELAPVRAGAGGVLESHAGPVLRGGQPHCEPGDVASELPRHLDVAGRLTYRDLATGVAFQLVAATEAQVSADRQEPPRDPFR